MIYDGADMSKPEAIAKMVRGAVAEFGAIDILVNNAGIQHVAPVEEFPVEKWDAILAINLSAAFHTVRAALPAMKKKGWGRIVNIASAHALVASPFKSAYVAAKHGIAGFTKTVALEVAEQGITVNAVCPGYVLTPLVEKQIPDTAKARGISKEAVIRDVLLAAQPTKKFVTVEEVAALAAFLCSADARVDQRRGAAGRRRLDRSLKGCHEARIDSSRANRAGAAGRRRAGRVPGGGVRGAAQRGHRARLGDRHLDRRDQRRADRGQRARRPAAAAARVLAPRRAAFAVRELRHACDRHPGLLRAPAARLGRRARPGWASSALPTTAPSR